MVCTLTLGLKTPDGATISERETLVLDEIAKLKADRPKRKPAASEARLKEVTRDVTREMVDGETAARVAQKYGISEDQARRVVAQEVQRACRAALGRRAGQATQAVATYDWIASTTREGVLRRARVNVGLVHAALAEHWSAQDARAKERQV